MFMNTLYHFDGKVYIVKRRRSVKKPLHFRGDSREDLVEGGVEIEVNESRARDGVGVKFDDEVIEFERNFESVDRVGGTEFVGDQAGVAGRGVGDADVAGVVHEYIISP